IIDSFQRICAGACRGMGRQYFGAMTYVVSYYFCGMPIGIYFGLNGFMGNGNPMHLKGLWLGSAISVAVSAILFLILRLCVNWERVEKRRTISNFPKFQKKKNLFCKLFWQTKKKKKKRKEQVEKLKEFAREKIGDTDEPPVAETSNSSNKFVTTTQTSVQESGHYIMYDPDGKDSEDIPSPREGFFLLLFLF
ncbi:MATE efflux family protein subfamily, partial [Reticulomyxa filosa]